MIKKLCAALMASVTLVALSLSLSSTAAYAATSYFHAGATQDVVDSVLFANFGVAAPTLATTDAHSLAMMLAKDAAGDGVAIGWTVDPALNGDSDPHLFVFWWKGGVAQCYNATCAGYTAYSPSTYTVGQKLIAGTPQKFGIQYSGGAWWFWVGTTAGVGSYIGYITDSNWSAAWPTFSTVRLYGEVAAGVTPPTTQMGNGFCSDNALALTIGSVSYTAGTTVDLATYQSNAAVYSATRLSARTFRYGGDGTCP